eukprot:1314937-Amorphochlora_amoeboformis.AAC.1
MPYFFLYQPHRPPIQYTLRIPCIPRSNLDSSCPNLSKVRREWWREPGFATAISRARSESMPMSRLRQTSTQATITQLFVLSSVIVAAGVAAGAMGWDREGIYR